ncbi:MAG: hypothetical protein JO022_18665, partial [Acidobacteriaceae bacterium]|nr:hypothetical protein [Acidobacteriaceae bacterium]
MTGLRHFAAALLCLAAAPVSRGDEFPVLASCSDPSEITAKVSSTDRVDVHFGLAEGDQTCYSITARVHGSQVQGYLLGKGHPAIAEFEKRLADSIPIGPPPPPAPPKPAQSAQVKEPEGPSSFAGLRGTDMNGRTLDLNRVPAPRVILYFWNPRDKRSVASVQMLEY